MFPVIGCIQQLLYGTCRYRTSQYDTHASLSPAYAPANCKRRFCSSLRFSTMGQTIYGLFASRHGERHSPSFPEVVCRRHGHGNRHEHHMECIPRTSDCGGQGDEGGGRHHRRIRLGGRSNHR
ncbi:hypothetical protein P46FS4_48 [Salmonella phage P46FS4]|uniref:Uncharacterized protein n=1 Tax=Salmonella phage P46FS4 TaxID=2712940 RepID=A0A6G6XTF1_9CAUD|nr:hypothetical protein HYQ39_gp048 [Salmonella phage P46FS4]QIG62114.1 hypothetical protein P46FS4_48 [Salmonella phage P46FS4]